MQSQFYDKITISLIIKFRAASREWKVVEHVRERKSNAAKQFAYNKLKNESYARAAAAATVSRPSSRNAPQRPPQPKLDTKSEKEGMLIDLTSPQQHDIPKSSLNRVNKFVQELNGISILDTPIDVPTEDIEPDAAQHFDSPRIDPPPYQSPPMYCNADRKVREDAYQNVDPFDTSHIMEMTKKQQQQQPQLHAISNDSAIIADLSNVMQTRSISNFESSTFLRNKSNQADDSVSRKMLSYSPKPNRSSMYAPSHYQSLKPNSMTALQSTSSENIGPLMPLTDDMLNGSLVNLNALSLTNSPELSGALAADEEPKIDMNFLAQLQKHITKNDATDVNIRQPNDAATVNVKETTVTTISSNALGQNKAYWTQNDTGAYGLAQTQSPSKYKQTNNFDGMATGQMQMALAKKTHNIDVSHLNGMNPTNSTQSNTELTIYGNYGANTKSQLLNGGSSTGIDLAIYGNYGVNATNGGHTMQSTALENNSERIQYGSCYYDAVAQSVIYDEVAAEEEYVGRLRPHRSAPVAPSPLSAQQIQRRLEKAQKDQVYGHLGGNAVYSNGYLGSGGSGGSGSSGGSGGGYEEIQNSHQRIQQLLQDISNDATEQEARDALNAVNWDHHQAVKHFKIERLLR